MTGTTTLPTGTPVKPAECLPELLDRIEAALERAHATSRLLVAVARVERADEAPGDDLTHLEWFTWQFPHSAMPEVIRMLKDGLSREIRRFAGELMAEPTNIPEARQPPQSS